MSFSPDWLALREAADHAARATALADRLRAAFAARAEMTVVDLGCGTGSNLRATAPALPARQNWLLVDNDPRLIAAARRSLAAWADAAEADGEGLLLMRDGRRIAVAFAGADLSGGVRDLLAGADLVTAAALFDLVSEPWIEGFAAALAQRRLPLYAVLTYDGRQRWTPPHPADAAMLAAFHVHQAGDKGFGAAAGPRAADALAGALRRAGYRVARAPSPWRLGPDRAALVRALAAGVAGAARETGRVDEGEIAAWLAARLEEGAACEIGHADLFAVPG